MAPTGGIAGAMPVMSRQPSEITAIVGTNMTALAASRAKANRHNGCCDMHSCSSTAEPGSSVAILGIDCMAPRQKNTSMKEVANASPPPPVLSDANMAADRKIRVAVVSATNSSGFENFLWTSFLNSAHTTSNIWFLSPRYPEVRALKTRLKPAHGFDLDTPCPYRIDGFEESVL